MSRKYIYAIQMMLDYMEQNYRKDIGVKDVAKAVNYAPMYCNHLFKSYFGDTISSYLQKLRMTGAKEMLQSGEQVKNVSREFAFDSESGFRKAFRNEYGVTPTTYVRNGEIKERYVKIYEYQGANEDWRSGKNPSPDGLWEYAYYIPATKEYALMDWTDARFEAPFQKADESDPNWYCRNRTQGYGMHPGREAEAVRTFRCPHSGTVEVFFSVGRGGYVQKKTENPCSVQLFHNEEPISPREGAAVLDSPQAIYLTATCSVKKGDQIRLHVNSLGNIHGDGVYLYRQQIGYLKITDEPEQE